MTIRRLPLSTACTASPIERAVGSFVQEKTSWPVQLHDPDLTIHVLVDENGLFTWTRRVPGPGGLPVGVSGRAACLLSGGIDSPVAAYMMMKRGMRLDFVHFHSVPRTDPASLEKVGGSMYKLGNQEAIANGDISDAGTINSQIGSGLLEMSNVDLTEEFTEMIIAQRGFQANSRTITTSDELLQEVVNLKR